MTDEMENKMRCVRRFVPATLALTALLVFPTYAVTRQASPPASPLRQPGARDVRLVLMIVIDQFRADYLDRFQADYTGGLRRLMTDGAMFVDANLEHYPTVTAAGHSTFGTGAMLSTSGIIGNDWFDRDTGKTVTSVSDDSVRQVGGVGKAGASPHRLLVSTIGDEIKMAGRVTGGPDGGPRSIGVSLKDRSAILPLGHTADAAYWYETASGQFVTSSYYAETLPGWVQAFNQRKVPDTFAGKTWPSLDAPARVLPATPGGPLYNAVYASPFGNDLLSLFAEQAIESERLGQRGSLDVLSVSFSSNDAIGHTYGPDSPEVRALAIDADRAIGRLLSTVDRLVGLDHVLIVLTADHGVAPVPEVLAANRMPGGRLAQKDLFDPIQAALAAKFGAGQWILSTAGTSPYLNYTLMQERSVDPVEARAVAAKAAAAVPHVARVYTRDQLLDGRVPSDPLTRRVTRGFSADRSGDLEILLEPFWMRQTTGTTHGTPYSYDTHIPLIFMGRGIRAGRYAQPAALNDVAPTLAAILRVGTPSGSVGRVLLEMFDSSLTRNGAATAPR